MNIAFFGSSLVSSYWNGAATYYRGLLKALAALGHRIVFFEPDAFDRQSHRDIPDPSWAKVIVYPATTSGWQAALTEAALGFEVVVKGVQPVVAHVQADPVAQVLIDAEQDLIHEREYGGIRSDTEGERGNGNYCKYRNFGEAAQRKPDIGKQM